jgi:hypothetical protein
MSLPPPPPGIDLAASKQPQTRGLIISTWVLALLAVALRFYARRISKAGFWWDDWLMIPALVDIPRLAIQAERADAPSDFCHDSLFHNHRMEWVLSLLGLRQVLTKL